MKKYISLIVLAACAFLMYSCNDADKFDYGKEVLVMTGTESNPIVVFAVEETPSSYAVTVSATGKAKTDINVTIAVDNSLVETYNTQHQASYYALPDSDVSLSTNTVTIEEGKASSTIAELTLLTDANFVDGRIYLIPVTIVNTDGPLDVLETSRTVYLRVSRVIDFMAYDLSQYQMYSNFIFDDALAVDLNEYTYEIKCFIDEWHEGSEPISRLCQWCDKDEGRSNMLRFGENGQDINSLQWVNPVGNIVSKTRFQTKTWYLLSFTYDGSTLSMYVDGVKDSEDSGDASTTFQRWEMGMSWGANYNRYQRVLGRMCELRVWNRALSTSEIQLGIAGVDVASDGLVGYWKFNEGEGHIFHDSTGHGYDMDWSNTWRDSNEDGNLTQYDYSSYAESSWVYDSYNKATL
ncbi:MAG: DUF1735 and LamG domain-containing protein [Bacteroidales bacterium]|nr:DUF1735 and LamG domain-containing protein [Bacteroidales bacterium]